MLARLYFCIAFSIFLLCTTHAKDDSVNDSSGKKPETGAKEKPSLNKKDEDDEEIQTTTEEEEDDFTYPPLVTLKDGEFDRVANIDFGTWSPMDYAFRYFNRQNFLPKRPFDRYTDYCFKEYFRCVQAQVHPYPVCGVGFYSYRSMMPPFYAWHVYVDVSQSFSSTCELWLHNCRTQTRMYETAYENYCAMNRFFLPHGTGRRTLTELKKYIKRALNF